MSYDKGLSPETAARAQENAPSSEVTKRTSPPPTSPIYGFFHAISQNILFTAPPGSRFVLAPSPSLSITIFQARNLQLDGAHKFHPYVKVIQQDHKYTTATASSEHPVWNENFKFPVVSPVKELLVLELWDDKAFSRNLLGYLPIDLSLLPSGVEVVTWERLSNSPQGEISVGLTANGFGLETLPDDYKQHYEEWRPTVPPVADHHNNNGKGPEGPYRGKNIPNGYKVENGNVVRMKTSAAYKVLKQAKGIFSIKSTKTVKERRPQRAGKADR